MEISGRQTINCSVASCKYNLEGNYCSLEEIQVAPVSSVDSGQDDESMCSSYEKRDENEEMFSDDLESFFT